MTTLTPARERAALVASGCVLSLLAAWVLVSLGPGPAVAVALLPVVALGAVYVVTTGQAVLFVGAFALPMLVPTVVGTPIVGTVRLQDLIVVMALGALAFAALPARGRLPAIPRTPVLGWPLVLFGAAVLSATLRGHYAYGSSLMGQPLRLVIYAAIVAGLIGMTVVKLYRLLVATFYSGAVLIALMAMYYMATGGSAGDSSDLSTGGTRPLAISTSLYAAGALFLALLNLRVSVDTRGRVLHSAVAAVALFDVIAGFGRAAYVAVFLVGLVFMATSSRLRGNMLSLLPLAAPFVVLLAIAASRVAPEFVDSIGGRLASPPRADANVEWRIAANRAVFDQVREQPLFGVGFGRTAVIYVETTDSTTGLPIEVRDDIGQDPHNGYVFLLAGGGIVTLAAFLLLLGVFAADVVRRYRRTQDPTARLLLLWASATLFVFLFNAASGTSFESSVNVLTIWALLVLPAVVRDESPVGQDSVTTAPGIRRTS